MAYSARVALVTGANRGIGKEIARQLGRRGLTVLVGARRRARGAAVAKELRAEGIEARSLELDVTSSASVNAAMRSIRRRFGRLDVLVNNAGIAIDTARRDVLDVAVLRRTLETNLFGPYRVTAGMLPLLRRSASARIVNISSALGSITRNLHPGWDFAREYVSSYSLSKSALNALTAQLSILLRGEGIKVNAVCPGYVGTDMNGYRGPRTVQQGARIAVRMALLPANGPTGGYFNDEGHLPW